jgi:hypothetical protein
VTVSPTPHSPIADRAKALLGDRRLNRVVDSRLEAGVKTYGQTIDAWPGTPRRAAVMRLQELLDSINYALFEGDTMAAQADAAQVRRILGRYPDLTVEEMTEREPEVKGPTEAEQLRNAVRLMTDALARLNADLDAGVILDGQALLEHTKPALAQAEQILAEADK